MSSDGIISDRSISDWVSIGYYGEPGHIEGPAFGVMQNGILIAGCSFHGWQPDRGTIEISAMATGKGWVSRALLRAIGAYVFGQLGCQLLIARTSEHNHTVRRITQRLGCTEHRVDRLRGRNEAEIIIALTSEAWAKYEARL